MEGVELGVEVEEEFAGGGDEGDFSGFAGGAELVVKSFGVAVGLANGGECGEVEGAAHGCAATADVARGFGGAAVLRVRSDSGEAGDFLAVDGT